MAIHTLTNEQNKTMWHILQGKYSVLVIETTSAISWQNLMSVWSQSTLFWSPTEWYCIRRPTPNVVFYLDLFLSWNNYLLPSNATSPSWRPPPCRARQQPWCRTRGRRWRWTWGRCRDPSPDWTCRQYSTVEHSTVQYSTVQYITRLNLPSGNHHRSDASTAPIHRLGTIGIEF